jgi:SAM-dependent methyltransferase
MQRPPFEGLGSDPQYLRDTQYKDPSNLHARIALHAKYSKDAEPWYPWLAARVVWPEHGDVLEIGCGSGLLWASIGPLLPHLRLTLTDLSEGMVSAAAERAGDLPNIEIAAALACEAEHLPFDDGSFDVAVANHMLYHVPDPGQAAAELARVLRPDGVLMAATNGPRHLAAISELQMEVYGRSPHGLADRRFGKLNGAEVLGASFASVQWCEHQGVLECDDPEDIYAYVLSTSIAQESPPEKLEQLRAAIGARFDAQGGVLRTTKESGCFLARGPRRGRAGDSGGRGGPG